jgi:cell division initiation protein
VNLTPLEIRKHEFRKKFHGFDPEEVMAFLEIVSMEYENLVHENSMLNERFAMTDSQLKKFRTIETTLQETLLTAERSREETIKTARKQGEIIVREAEVRAAALIEEGQNTLVRLRNTFNELKMHKETYLAKLKTLVATQAELFQKYSFGEEKAFEKLEAAAVEAKIPPARKTPLQQIEEDIRRDSGESEEADAGNGAAPENGK